MPNSVCELFDAVGIPLGGSNEWGEPIDEDRPGVYIVALTGDPCREAPLDLNQIERWRDQMPLLTLDGKRPALDELVQRLHSFWLPDESILYIGKTVMPIRVRLQQFCIHELGRGGPHCGGSWIKALSISPKIIIYWAVTNNPSLIESQLLHTFMESVSPDTRHGLYDPTLPLPFANLEICEGGQRLRKKHGLQQWHL